MTLRFLFVGEGSSDTALVRPLEDLCLDLGVSEVQGIAPDIRQSPESGLTVASKLRSAIYLEPDVDLIFVHRDADKPDDSERVKEIENAVEDVDPASPVVPVVPIQETEAWALLSEQQIRSVADNPNGNVDLDIPTPSQVESIAPPKKHLEEQLVKASEHSGRHRRRFKRDLSSRKFFLIERISINGPISQVQSWTNLRTRLERALEHIA